MKRLLKAILWIGCYGGTSWFGIKAKLGFDILNQNNWAFLFDKSVHAVWPADMAPKKLVCKVLLVFIIVGILGLAVVTKKKKRRIPLVYGELPQKEGERPQPVASQGKMATTSAPAPQAQVGELNNVMSPAPQNLLGDVIRQITAIANTFEVSVFPHVKLENTFTQLVVSDDATALLLKILPQSGTWQITQEEMVENSQWAIENEPAKPILKDIIESTATLARLEPDAHAISVIILAGGTLNETENVRSYLEQNGIRIVSLKGDIPNIPSWQELLNEFYQPKQVEEMNETNNNP